MPGFYIVRYASLALFAILFAVWYAFPPHSSADTYNNVFEEVIALPSSAVVHDEKERMSQVQRSSILTIFDLTILDSDNVDNDSKAVQQGAPLPEFESQVAPEESQSVVFEVESPSLVAPSLITDVHVDELVILDTEAVSSSVVPNDPFFIAFEEALERIRQTHNLQSLIFHADLSNLAIERSLDMAKRRYFSHINPDGCGIRCQFQNSTIPATKWAENIGWYEPYTYLTKSALAQEFLMLWMESSGHRANLLDADITHYGVGTALQGDKIIITMLFARME